jgi:hypothetical protein
MADREIAFSGVILESLSIGCGKLAVRLTGSTVIDPTDELGVSGPEGYVGVVGDGEIADADDYTRREESRRNRRAGRALGENVMSGRRAGQDQISSVRASGVERRDWGSGEMRGRRVGGRPQLYTSRRWLMGVTWWWFLILAIVARFSDWPSPISNSPRGL